MKGTIVQIGVAMNNHAVNQMPLMSYKIVITGSTIGGLPDTQKCIDFCHKHKIVPKIKLVTTTDIDEVYASLHRKNDSIIRNVLDIEASILKFF